MSIGCSIGDFVAIGMLAWDVFKACKGAPEGFENISREVLSLHAVLKESEETVFALPLSPEKQARLNTIGDGCRHVLEELQSLVQKYWRLGTQTRRTWDRMKWHTEDIAELRTRLTSNVLMLNTWISTSQVDIGKRLDNFIREFREGRFEGSVISAMTADSLSADEKREWRTIRKNLKEIGITTEAFNDNKDFIINWFTDAIATRAFGEEASDEEASDEEASDEEASGEEASGEEAFDDESITEPSKEGVLNTRGDSQYPLQEGPPDLPVAEPQISAPRGSQTTGPSHLGIREPHSTTITAPTIAATSRKAAARETKDQPAPTRRRGDPLKPRIPRFAAMVAALSRPQSRFLSAMNQKNYGQARAILSDDAQASIIDLPEALYISVRGKSEEMTQLALEKGCDINTRLNLKGETALMVAVKDDNEVIVQLLLRRGCDANARNRKGDTALVTAVNNNNEQIARLLLKKSNTDHSRNAKALAVAVKNNNEQIVRLLLEKGDGNVEGILVTAASIGNEQIVRLLLSKGADINARDNTDNFALYSAADAGHVRTVRLLLEKGADANARKDGIYDTALSIAEFRKHDQIIIFLLQKGAIVGARNIALLISSVESGDNQMLQMLIKNGLDPNTPGQGGEFALHQAIMTRNVEAVHLLLEAGADTNAHSADSSVTALDMATRQATQIMEVGEGQAGQLAGGALEKSRQIVEMLVLGGAAVSTSKQSHVDLLFSASTDGNDRIVRAMLQGDMDANATGSAGIPVLHPAVRSGNVQLVKVLLENGADIVFQNIFSNETLLDIAKASGNDEMVQLLIAEAAKPKPPLRRDPGTPGKTKATAGAQDRKSPRRRSKVKRRPS